MIALEVKDLKKSFGDVEVIKGISLSVQQGEVFGFIGKNGAGKTTTINMILSLIHRTSGNISVMGHNVNFEDQSYKIHIGYVPDVPTFPKHLSAREYLQYTLDMFGEEIEEKRITSMLNFVSLQDTKKKISNYSRGMKQRLAIAQALIHDPDILIMDEPTSALDPQGRKDVMDIMLKLKGKKTIFYSTHILEDVEKVCDRIGIIDGGEIKLVDAVDNLKHAFVSNQVFVSTKDKKRLESAIKDSDMAQRYKIEANRIVLVLKEGKTGNDVLNYLISKGEEIVSYGYIVPSVEETFLRITND
jgi:ABC-2 type transport system ATP-binding protein